MLFLHDGRSTQMFYKIKYVLSVFDRYSLDAGGTQMMCIMPWQMFNKRFMSIWACPDEKSITQRYSLYYHRELNKAEKIHIWEAVFREFGHLSLKGDQKRLIDYQKTVFA